MLEICPERAEESFILSGPVSQQEEIMPSIGLNFFYVLKRAGNEHWQGLYYLLEPGEYL
jgi:hypothetical protein